MIRGTYSARHDEAQQRRFTDEMFAPQYYVEPKPPKETPTVQRCPCCERPMPGSRSTIASMFVGAIRRLFSSMFMLFCAMFRLVRFILAGVLFLLGQLGRCCRSLGIRLAHPDDRRFFTRSV